MQWFAIILVILMLICWVYGAIRHAMKSLQTRRGLRRWLPILASFLMAYGATGFFGSFISALGGLNWLGPDFEWPAGYASGIVGMPNGDSIVPIQVPARLQMYDANWKFLRGWHVDSGGGDFKIRKAGPDVVELITARGRLLMIYDLQGREVSRKTYEDPDLYNQFAGAVDSASVPTALWLRPFTSPLYCWAVAATGLVINILLSLNQQRPVRSPIRRLGRN